MSRSGPLAGTRFPIPDGKVRIGRAPDNDIIADSATVSLYHAEISNIGGTVRIRDLESTNGTWINGERIADAEVSLPAAIQLGTQGPEFSLIADEPVPSELDRTIEVPAPELLIIPEKSESPSAAHVALLTSAVTRARRMRAHGVTGQTLTIMRGVIDQALRRSYRRFRVLGYSLIAALVVVSSLALWKILTMKQEKSAIDTHIQSLEAELQKANDQSDIDTLLAKLGAYQNEGESLEKTLLYRISTMRDHGDFVTQELHAVMAEFGAEVYSIPPDFIERVNHYIKQDQGPDRPLVAKALNEAGAQIATMRRILTEERLPPDLAYIPIVESAMRTAPVSAAGAAGPWQFTAPTARTYGLRVDNQVDERKDVVKSTRASCKYLRDLILDFGSGSSVLLALAAYDTGPFKVKEAVSKTVKDPIGQRDFWYLYRRGALPLETREYVPKVFAAILIGRNPHHFGF